MAAVSASDHTTNPLTAGGGCIFVGVRVRPLANGRSVDRRLVQVDSKRGIILVEPTAARAASKVTPSATVAAIRLQALQRGKSARKLILGADPSARPEEPSAKSLPSSSEQSESCFRFASVYQDESNQQIFELVGRPLVNNVCIGYNGTLFAYGQTGSGKTHTIGEVPQIGTPVEGVAHRVVRELYSTIETELGDVMRYTVQVQFVQVHLERVYDLFVPAQGQQDGHALHVREDAQEGIYVAGAKTLSAPSLEGCLDLLRRGSQNLIFAATQMNRQSSRSHAVCRLLVHGQLRDGEEAGMILGGATTVDGAALSSGRTRATLTLCDLAGSEE